MKRRGVREKSEFDIGKWRMNGRVIHGENSRIIMSSRNSPGSLYENLSFLNSNHPLL